MQVWEVFQQKGHTDAYAHVGSVLAPDPLMAMSYAKECFFRRKEGMGLWVVRRADVHQSTDHGLLEQVTDKSYRYPEAYRGVVAKRELARAKFAPASAPRRAAAVAGDDF